MPTIEICQGDRTSLIYGLSIPHKRTFFTSSNIIGTTNKYSQFSKDKLIIFQNGHIKYRLKETNRLNWTLRTFLPVCVFLFCLVLLISFPWYEFWGVFLVIVSIIVAEKFFCPQYIIFEGDVEIGFITTRKNPIGSFSISKDVYCVYAHSHERYSLIKNGTQIALYKRELEKYRSKYLIYFDSKEPVEIIRLFCLWIDLFYYDDKKGRIILKTFYPFDKHPEYTSWRPQNL